MNYQPFISVIVPVYNSDSTISQTIQSLLKQEYPTHKLEIIVVDNNSTDNTADIIQSYPVQYLRDNAVQSAYAARNCGIRAATGEILAFTDGDCIADPFWIQSGVTLFENSDIGGVVGSIATDRPKSLLDHALYNHSFLGSEHCLNNPFLPYAQTANAFYRKFILTQIGLFDDNFVSGGDADLSWRLQLNTKLRLVSAPKAVVYHQHRKSLSAFWNQRITHGRGRADLEFKYATQMKQRGVKTQISNKGWMFGLQIFRCMCYRACRSLFYMLTLNGKSFLGEWIFLGGEVAFHVGCLERKQELDSLI